MDLVLDGCGEIFMDLMLIHGCGVVSMEKSILLMYNCP